VLCCLALPCLTLSCLCVALSFFESNFRCHFLSALVLLHNSEQVICAMIAFGLHGDPAEEAHVALRAWEEQEVEGGAACMAGETSAKATAKAKAGAPRHEEHIDQAPRREVGCSPTLSTLITSYHITSR
jgi:hypothetical protein